jgi:hypothetical protein
MRGKGRSAVSENRGWPAPFHIQHRYGLSGEAAVDFYAGLRASRVAMDLIFSITLRFGAIFLARVARKSVVDGPH